MFLGFFIACVFKSCNNGPRCGSLFPVLVPSFHLEDVGIQHWEIMIDYLFSNLFFYSRFSVICFWKSYYLGTDTDICALVCLYIYSYIFSFLSILGGVFLILFPNLTIEIFILLILFCNFPGALSGFFYCCFFHSSLFMIYRYHVVWAIP